MATHRPHDRHLRAGRRFFRSGELHLVLLALVARRPQHGYDLMSELDAHFGPTYRPSPGSIYPALNALEAEALVAARDLGDRRVYEVTDLGRQALRDREAMLADVEARTGVKLGGDSIEPALARLTARVRAVTGRVETADVETILDEAGDRIEGLSATGDAP